MRSLLVEFLCFLFLKMRSLLGEFFDFFVVKILLSEFMCFKVFAK